MKLLCRLFGHKPDLGYEGTNQIWDTLKAKWRWGFRYQCSRCGHRTDWVEDRPIDARKALNRRIP